MKRRDFLRSSLGATGLVACAGPLVAQAAPVQIPLEDFFKDAQFEGVTLSPNGKFLGALVSVKGKQNLAVVDIEKNQVNVLTAFKDSEVNEYQWQNNDRLLYRLRDRIPDPNYAVQGDGLFAIDRDAGNFRELIRPSKEGSTDTSISYVYRFAAGDRKSVV
jgi:hypothetical protein